MLNYDMNARDGVNKTEYLYLKIKSDIMAGVLIAEEKLPSKRELAEHLSISVITVENAYAMLEEEGYIYSKPRSGFYVSELSNLIRAASAGRDAGSGRSGRSADAQDLSAWASDAAQSDYTAAGHIARSAQMLPEDEILAEQSPARLARYVRRVLSERPEIVQMRPPHYGCAVLRNAIAGFLRRYRGMDVSPRNIIIGSGAEYLYGMLVQLFGRNVTFGIESPSYKKIEQVYRANGARLDFLKMGKNGITSTALKSTQAKILHVSPYHSYPTGVTATAEKRYEYLAWAHENQGYIIEDDFDSEFAFYRRPIEPLFSLDHSQRVIYMNTFSKSISPSIRVAYMILPDPLLEIYDEKLSFYSCPVPVLDQYVLAAFIDDGAFERHLGKLRHAGW